MDEPFRIWISRHPELGIRIFKTSGILGNLNFVEKFRLVLSWNTGIFQKFGFCRGFQGFKGFQ